MKGPSLTLRVSVLPHFVANRLFQQPASASSTLGFWVECRTIVSIVAVAIGTIVRHKAVTPKSNVDHLSRPSSLELNPKYARDNGPKLRLRLTQKTNCVEALGINENRSPRSGLDLRDLAIGG